ncbi:hypothetical protein CRG98_001129 [Punica granatum]|uniref:Uncharacterized protein n=1 Tax=Punica granatum TaxID=22663 RepID=A0A2I0LCS7_PUNGR|nr:hypothetical protein CRG98_001129 [Punica granatum]
MIRSIRDSFRKTTITVTSGGRPITLGANDHHDHLEGSLGYPGPLTLPQNSIGSLRGDVRPDLCQSGLFSVPDGLQSNPNHQCNDSNLSKKRLRKPLPIYFEEGLDKGSHVPEIEESLHRLENHQLTSVEPTEEINIVIVEEPRTLRIGTGLDPAEKSPTDRFLDRVSGDNAARHTQFSFMDGFSRYNQIQMVEEDKVKTTFITMWGTFCYKVKPFGLENAEATYQRAMVTLFPDMMHKEIEVYVDDMITKSKEGEDHLVILKRLFEHLKKYKFQLNPAKCTFGVKSGKLLGFVVSEKGIEVDLDKVQAIMELLAPLKVCEVRSFIGRLNYIVRFIANLTDKCQPLFRLLRKNATVEWDNECQKAFDTVKAYLIQPSVLGPPSPDHPLILYLIVRRKSLGCMLGQKDDFTHAEQAIYYLNKKFSEGESNCPDIAKMCCALTDPLKYLLDSLSSMRNLAKWRCQLMEYDIEYVPRTSMKGQAIADHLAEFPIDDDTPVNSDFLDKGILQLNDEEESPRWKMYFDGAVNSTRSGIGAVLISPEGCHFPVAAKIDFPCTNNVAEYEACILGLQAAVDLKVKELEVFGDSMLTIFQTLKQRKAKDPKLVSYHEYLEELVENFEKVSSPNFFLDGETLYHRSFDATLLRCVDENEAQRLMEEVHMNGLMLAKKLIRLGYFWGKFAYKYDGPFIVKEVFDGGPIILNDMDGNENALLVNADALKKYYP